MICYKLNIFVFKYIPINKLYNINCNNLLMFSGFTVNFFHYVFYKHVRASRRSRKQEGSKNEH